MWCRASLLACLVLFTASAAPPALAQLTTEDKPYATPPAWKSVEVGDFYFKRKKYRAALSRYQEAVTTDPYYAQGYLGLGRVYDHLGLGQKALDAYRKYLDLLPSAKEAEEAKDVHAAISRLEKKLKPRGGSQHSDGSSATQNSRRP